MGFIFRAFLGIGAVLLLAACNTGAPVQPSPPAPSGMATAQEAGALPPSTTPLATAQAQTPPSSTHSVPLVHTPAPTALSATTQPTTPTPILSGEPSSATFVYNVPPDDSLRALDLTSGAEDNLGDPTAPQQILPWSPAPHSGVIALVTGKGWGVKGPARGWTAALWTLNSDGSQPRKLLDQLPPDGITLPAIEARNVQTALTTLQHPVWTPDGSTVIVASAHEGQVDLYAVATDGSQIRRLTSSPAMEVRPSIAPDGGELKDLGQAACADIAWSAQGQLAVSGGDDQPGLLAEADGTRLSALPPGAVIAGWFDSALYYFQRNEGQGWQLMLRTGHEEAPIGQPVGQRPEGIELVVGEQHPAAGHRKGIFDRIM